MYKAFKPNYTLFLSGRFHQQKKIVFEQHMAVVVWTSGFKMEAKKSFFSCTGWSSEIKCKKLGRRR